MTGLIHRSQQGIGQMRSWKSQPTSSSLAVLSGTGDRDDADWIIAEDEISICLRDDGSEFLLGKGAFGKVCDRTSSEKQVLE